MEEISDQLQTLDKPTATPIGGVESPPVPPESAPLADLADFAGCRTRWADEVQQGADQALRTTGLARWEAGWAWSVIKKRIDGGEVFNGLKSFREWADTKSGVSKETVYRWIRVVSRVTKPEAQGRTPKELLVDAGEMDSPEVQQAKKDAEQAAKRKVEFDQDETEKEGIKSQEAEEEEDSQGDDTEMAEEADKPTPRRTAKQRMSRPKDRDNQDGDRVNGNGTAPTSSPPPSFNLTETDQLEKLRQAKATIEGMRFPTPAVQSAARELAEKIQTLLGPRKSVPTGKWEVRSLGWMEPDKGCDGNALADSVVGGTVKSTFSIGLRPVNIIGLEIGDGGNGKPSSTAPVDNKNGQPSSCTAEATGECPFEFTEEELITTWLQRLEKGATDAAKFPLTVMLPLTAKQKQALREQMEDDLDSYQPSTLDNR